MNDIPDFAYPDAGAGLAPPVSIAAASDPAFARARRTLEAAGWRTTRSSSDAAAGSAPLWVELDGVPDARLETLIARADRAAGEQGLSLIVAAPRAALDTIAALVTAPASEVLIDAGEIERAAAAATMLALANRPARAFEAAREVDLVSLSAEVSRIADTLARLSGAAPAPLDAAPAPAPTASAEVDPARVRAAIRERRLRARHFDPSLFADPAWAMLLDLYSAELDGKPVPVSSLCAAAEVPPTTALRWIRGMTERGLFERKPDPTDARRIFVRLAEDSRSAMQRYFAEL